LPVSFEHPIEAEASIFSTVENRLRKLSRIFSSLPGYPSLRTVTRKVLLVAAPTRNVFMRPDPASPARRNCQEITILSANLWHDWPRQTRRLERLEAFSSLVEAEKVDICLLQEVARTPELRADEWLADRLGMAYVYSRANGHESSIGFEEGLAVFSRFPLSQPRLRRLGPLKNPFVRRLALGATLQTPCGDLSAYSVHLGLMQKENAAQVRHLREWVGSQPALETALIGGDFNAHEDTPQMQAARRSWIDLFRQHSPQGDGATHELTWPWGKPFLRQRLDYLFVQPGRQIWRILEARHLDAPGGPHSDHRAVLARLALAS